MNKRIIFEFAILGALLVLASPVAFAHIEISDMGHYYDPAEGLLGYVNCQNAAEYDLNGAVFVFVDDEIVTGKIIRIPVRYIAGFRCSPTKTFEFPINTSKGDHTIVAYVYSMNDSVERIYGYCAEDWWVNQGDEIESEPEEEMEEDWLACSWMCGGS